METEKYWQCDKSLKQSLEIILHQQLYCDVTFLLLDEHSIGAHYSILASRSPVFAAMTREKKSFVCITDVEDDVFWTFLRYLYSDNVDITADNFYDLLYLAEMYLVDILKDKCVDFMFQSISLDNVLFYFGFSYYYNIPALHSQAVKIIKCFSDILLKSNEYRKLTNETKGMICYSINRKYGNQSCFTNTVLDHNTDADVETFGILQNKYVGHSNCDEVFRFEQHNGKWKQDNQVDAISFESDTELYFGGILMYGGLNRQQLCHVNIRVLEKDAGEILFMKTILTEPLDAFTFRVNFPERILVQPDKKYTILTFMDVPYCYKGFHGAYQMQYGGCNIFIFNSTLSTNRTTVQRGQIPGFLLRKVNTP